MHIVYATLTKLGESSGGTIHITEVAQEWARCGIKVTLIGSGAPQEELEGVEVNNAGRIISRGVFTRLFTFCYLVLRVFYQVLRLRRRTDILYTRDALLGCWFTMLRDLFRLPVVFEVNGLRADESRVTFGFVFRELVCAIGKWAERTTARKADAVICVTEGIRDILRDEYGVPEAQMTVVPNGVNLQLYTPQINPQEQEKLRQSLDLHADDLIILYIGILKPWQDVTTLIKATGQLELQGQKVVLLIVGDGIDRARLEAEAALLPAPLRVIFTGRVPNKQAPVYISLAAICTLPRTRAVNERIGLSPIKLFSYLACGKPVVASRIGGLEFLEANGLGTLVSCGDAEAFAQALSYWLNVTQKPKDRVGQGPTLPEKNKKTAEIQGKARRYAEEHCGWDRTAKAVYEVCGELVASKEGAADARRYDKQL
jgi:alpha-maltose-1-phosphate synthase